MYHSRSTPSRHCYHMLISYLDTMFTTCTIPEAHPPHIATISWCHILIHCLLHVSFNDVSTYDIVCLWRMRTILCWYIVYSVYHSHMFIYDHVFIYCILYMMKQRMIRCCLLHIPFPKHTLHTLPSYVDTLFTPCIIHICSYMIMRLYVVYCIWCNNIS